MRDLPLRLGLLLLVSGCAAAPDSSRVQVTGSLREALRDGQTQTRIRLSNLDLTDRVGVGAATGLDGEITLLDGICFVSRVRDGELVTERHANVEATLLFEARVTSWHVHRIERDLAPDELAGFVQSVADDLGLDTEEPIPFVVNGTLTGLDAHVLNGDCPIRAAVTGTEMANPPLRLEHPEIQGKLVGIYASNGGGVITHHGSTTHVHAVIETPKPWTGHCDSVGIQAGADLLLPATTD